MNLKHLIGSLGKYKVLSASGNIIVESNPEILGISNNSKAVKDNFIFVAIKGVHQDGDAFIEEAVSNGAKVVILQDAKQKIKQQTGVLYIGVNDARKALAKLAAIFYGNPSSKMKVVGITGTNGKTTISYLLEAILKEAGFAAAVIGTINYRFKEKVFPSKNTTPGPLELQSICRQMLQEQTNYLVMEVSSHALDQDRTAGIVFHSAVFTNLTQDHLDYHSNLSNYFKAKSKLFKNLETSSFAVLNNDDPYGRKLVKSSPAQVITYGIKKPSFVRARNIIMDLEHTEFQVSIGKIKTDISTRLIGAHNVYNILASIAWAAKEGISLEKIKSAIAKFNTVPGRLEKINCKRKVSVFVDYAHTEDALKNVIDSLRKVSSQRIITVFGCGGERDKTKRPKMGRIVTELADYAIITNDNPRSEDPCGIIEDIKNGIRKHNYCVIPDRFEAIKKSLSYAIAGDIVLVAGKGHEDYQIIKDKVLHFDDREAIKACLSSMK